MHRKVQLPQSGTPHPAGKSQSKHILGIQPVTNTASLRLQGDTSTSTQLSSPQLTELLETERAENLKLQEDSHPRGTCPRTYANHSLRQQADQLINKSNTLTACGPDIREHFYGFSVDRMIHDICEQVPDVYALFMQLGDVEKNVSSGGTSAEELKAVSALCTVLNARCSRMKGMQLLISMMLIARSTGRKVST